MVMPMASRATEEQNATPRLEVPKGYKQTEIGIIPDDWHIVNASSIGRFRGGSGFPIVYQGHSSGEYPFFKVSDMNNDGNETFMVTANNYISEATRALLGATVFPAQTIVFAKVGAAVFLERKKLLAKPSCLDNNMAGYALSDAGVHPRYILYFLLKFRMGSLVSTTALPSLSGSVLADIKIPLPPTRTEQEAIAEALADADSLIESLEQLIAKKRQIKQGAMQELLTGNKRLPGFSGQWVTTLLGDITHIKTGGRNNEDKTEEGEYPFFVRSATVEHINSYSYDCEAILVPGEGGIGSIFHYVRGRFDVHQRVYAITHFSPEISGRFLYFYMVQKFGAHAMQNTVKATVDSLRLPTFQNFEILMPPTLDEQTAIATVLSAMDNKLTALEQRLAKTQRIKQGMMQELLTGRIRLV